MSGEVAKKLASIIYPLLGQSPHHIKTQQFVDHIKSVLLEPGEVMTFYDVKAQFVLVPMDLAIAIVQHKLQWYCLLPNR